MQRVGTEDLPFYPEERATAHPTAEQIFRLFSRAERHVLALEGRTIRTFHPVLTPLRNQVRLMLGVPTSAYTATA